MRVVIAPDSFKGALTALEVAQEIEAGWKQALPGAECVLVPLADGGEGTVAALVDATGGEFVEVQVTGPYGASTAAVYGLLGNSGDAPRRAVIEMSSASGLHLRTNAKTMSPRDASSIGTGQLIADALSRGVRHIILGLGGSATNDAGAGMMQALGVRFLDSSGNDLPPGGLALSQLVHIDASQINPLVADCRFDVAIDVDNPLCGPNGASTIFGAQKGASPTDIDDLDHALSQVAEIVRSAQLGDFSATPGAGAAGGTGFGALTFLNAELMPGIDVVIDAVGLHSILTGADLLITGEGQIDRQTLSGKTPYGAMKAGANAGVPTVAIVGSIGPGADELIDAGMAGIFGIVAAPVDLDTALADSRVNLRRTARSVAALWDLGRNVT